MADKDQIYVADAHEAFESFRVARNFFFLILLVGLLVMAAAFWMVDYGLIDPVLERQVRNQEAVYVRYDGTGPGLAVLTVDEGVPEVAEQAQGEAAEPEPLQRDEGVTYERAESYDVFISLSLRAWNYIMPFGAVIYCLILLIGMKLALVGRLGGLAESGRAFFVGLVAMVLILPWQQMVSPILWGSLYTYQELVAEYMQVQQRHEMYFRSAYYGRFVGMWGITLLMLLVAQWRSRGATKAVNKRIAEIAKASEEKTS